MNFHPCDIGPVTVGDGTDADLFLTSTELNSYGTEVWLKFGRGDTAGAATISPVTAVAQAVTSVLANCTISLDTVTTNFLDEAAETNTFTIVTNATLTLTTRDAVTNVTTTTGTALTSTAVGRKLYTSADTVDFIFTPATGYNLAETDYGEVRFYLRIWDAR